MPEGFTVKEIVQQIYEKQEKMEDKIDKIHTQTKVTNGTVQLHTKLVWGSYGFTASVLATLVTLLFFV